MNVEDVARRGLHGLPTKEELVEAVREFLQSGGAAGADDQKARYFTRVSANVLGIVQRELELGPSQEAWWDEAVLAAGFPDTEALCLAIRRREVTVADEVVWPLLVASVEAKLRVANPRYLDDADDPDRTDRPDRTDS